MYSVKIIKSGITLFEKEFRTLAEADDFEPEHLYDYPCEYQILDKSDNSIIEEGDLYYDENIKSDMTDNLFPDKKGEDPIDLDTFFEKGFDYTYSLN
jgi:hypothetical protein